MEFLVELVRCVCDAPSYMPEPKTYQKLLDFNTKLLKGIQRVLHHQQGDGMALDNKTAFKSAYESKGSKTPRGNRMSLPLGIFTPGKSRRSKTGGGSRSFADLSETMEDNEDTQQPLSRTTSSSSIHVGRIGSGSRSSRSNDTTSLPSRESAEEAFNFRLPTDDFTLGTVGEYTAIATTKPEKSLSGAGASQSGGEAGTEGSPTKNRDNHILSKHRIKGDCTLAQLLVVLGRALLHAVNHKLALTNIPIGHTLMSATQSTLSAIIQGSFENHSWDRNTKQLTSSILELRRQPDQSKKSTGQHFQHLNNEFSYDQSMDIDTSLAAWTASFCSVAVYLMRLKGRSLSNLWVSPLQRQLQLFTELSPHLVDIRCTDPRPEDAAEDTDSAESAGGEATDSFGSTARGKQAGKDQGQETHSTVDLSSRSSSNTLKQAETSPRVHSVGMLRSGSSGGNSTLGVDDNIRRGKLRNRKPERSVMGMNKSDDKQKITPGTRRAKTLSQVVTSTFTPSNLHTRNRTTSQLVSKGSGGSGSGRKSSLPTITLPSARTSSADLPGIALDSDEEKRFLNSQLSLTSMSNESFLNLPTGGKLLKRWAKEKIAGAKAQIIVESGNEDNSGPNSRGRGAGTGPSRGLSHNTTLGNMHTPSYTQIHGPNFGLPRRNSVSVSLLSPNPASPPSFKFTSAVDPSHGTITSISSSALPLYRKEIWLDVSQNSPPMRVQQKS